MATFRWMGVPEAEAKIVKGMYKGMYVEEYRPERTRGEQLRCDGGSQKKTKGLGNVGTDRSTTTKPASVRKQLGTKNSKSRKRRQTGEEWLS